MAKKVYVVADKMGFNVKIENIANMENIECFGEYCEIWEIFDTIEILSPEILLKRVDLPTFGLPIIETIIKYKLLFFYFTYLRICNL